MATVATQLSSEERIISATEEPMISDTGEPIISDTIDATHEQIAARAYSYWLESGCLEGADEENWLRAEQELTGNQ